MTRAHLLASAGAGKSSLLACLLRLTEVTAGRITVDGADVSQVPLHLLRAAIGERAGCSAGGCRQCLQIRVQGHHLQGCHDAAGHAAAPACAFIHQPRSLWPTCAGVVPQVPFIFGGSVRQNLDPYGTRPDAELAATLRDVQLWEPLCALQHSAQQQGAVTAISSAWRSAALPPGPATSQQHVAVDISHSGATDAQHATILLDMQLGEGSLGLSYGQQQLLCLARVLLKRPKLLCLDECTASVDPATATTMHQVWGTV